MDTIELLGVIAVSFAPFLVSVGAVLSVGGSRKWPFLSYAFSFFAGLLAGKGFGFLLWSICWIIAWVFAGIALKARRDRSIRTSSPEDGQAHDAEVAFDAPDDNASPRGDGSGGEGQDRLWAVEPEICAADVKTGASSARTP
ncbi:hypothetical protein [Bradyrhizobium diazoefficiens]|uniref:hypothetical protein n=1 Tax=Bradyrhizobium diazoefficiens TaxID=1355477 RepID=UPI0011779516|nr:hypothetical protein [Bradyrhizobium diazoefficiens]WLB40510.1 hypothetical protein QIH78_12235 [Bradyrhizobium diazoefficiens]WLC14512.1 hypothetical protein QIH76_30795 [Bradyrhizobium diazoefficiens]